MQLGSFGLRDFCLCFFVNAMEKNRFVIVFGLYWALLCLGSE